MTAFSRSQSAMTRRPASRVLAGRICSAKGCFGDITFLRGEATLKGTNGCQGLKFLALSRQNDPLTGESSETTNEPLRSLWIAHIRQ
jgi:hypothetical protein